MADRDQRWVSEISVSMLLIFLFQEKLHLWINHKRVTHTHRQVSNKISRRENWFLLKSKVFLMDIWHSFTITTTTTTKTKYFLPCLLMIMMVVCYIICLVVLCVTQCEFLICKRILCLNWGRTHLIKLCASCVVCLSLLAVIIIINSSNNTVLQ